MPAVVWSALSDKDRQKQLLEWQSKLPLLPRKRHPEFIEEFGEDAVQQIIDESWLVEHNGLPACVACPCFSTNIGTLGILRKHAEATFNLVVVVVVID